VPLRVRLYAVVLACGCGLPLPSLTPDQADTVVLFFLFFSLVIVLFLYVQKFSGCPDTPFFFSFRFYYATIQLFYLSVQLSFLLHGQALTPSTLYIGYHSTFNLY
jgi:hypothetical protein